MRQVKWAISHVWKCQKILSCHRTSFISRPHSIRKYVHYRTSCVHLLFSCFGFLIALWTLNSILKVHFRSNFCCRTIIPNSISGFFYSPFTWRFITMARILLSMFMLQIILIELVKKSKSLFANSPISVSSQQHNINVPLPNWIPSMWNKNSWANSQILIFFIFFPLLHITEMDARSDQGSHYPKSFR